MRLEVHHETKVRQSVKVARVESMFNVEPEAGRRFDLEIDLDLEGIGVEEWALGAIVGPSGSGKTSLGGQVFGAEAIWAPEWTEGRALVDSFSKANFDDITGALASVGLGDVPAWLRPYSVLSMGEQFRANLARLLVEAPGEVVLDEFTSVVDRQIAKIGALAFGKAWKRGGGQCVILSCHYDILPWLKPDWVLDLAGSTGRPEEGEGGTDPRLATTVEPRDWLAKGYKKIMELSA